MDDRQHKSHRPSHSGVKAEKKKDKGKEKQKGFNEKVRMPHTSTLVLSGPHNRTSAGIRTEIRATC